ncbi:DUF968 domain-containing protein [Oryzomonas rubra]|uniref:DUF968 domain-containing protein n=1 Tax=Oryzomonas rubra TaxID=2509454 RepID=A0A5A9XAW1_9BACT|nr:DUF968 domain-containing protein [Oryzomonas rubra]
MRYTFVYPPAMLFPKETAERDEVYLQFIRSLPCAKCGRFGPSNAHHHPAAGHSSIGLKVSDYRAVPLCGCECHLRVHQIGKRSFWGDLDAVEDLIARLNILFYSRSL